MVNDASGPKMLPPEEPQDDHASEERLVESPEGEETVASGPDTPRVPLNGAEPAEVETEEGKGAQVRELLDQGYSFDQINKEFGFSRGIIYKEQKKRVKPTGALVPAAKASQSQPEVMKLGRYEIIPPEQALAGIRLQDGDYKSGFTDGIRILLMAVRYTQELATIQANMMDPTIKMVQAMREEERLAAEKAQGTAVEVASRAAGAMADRVVAHFEDRLARIEAKATPGPGSGNPMMAMMVRVMEPLLNNMMGGMFGQVPKGQDGQPQVPGFTYKTVQEA